MHSFGHIPLDHHVFADFIASLHSIDYRALQGAYAPCIQMGQQIIAYENEVTSLTTSMIKGANAVLAKYNQSAIANLTGPLTGAQVGITWCKVD